MKKPSQEELSELLAPWRQVAARADAFFQQAADLDRAGEQRGLRCGPGCVDCCQQDLHLQPVEAVALLAAGVGQGAEGADPGSCALLGANGRCAAYQARPIICRTHGLAILYRQPPDNGALATAGQAQDDGELSWCRLNYLHHPPPAEAVLDGTLLLTALTVADQLLRRRLGGSLPERVAMSALAREGWGAL